MVKNRVKCRRFAETGLSFAVLLLLENLLTNRMIMVKRLAFVVTQMEQGLSLFVKRSEEFAQHIIMSSITRVPWFSKTLKC